MNANQLRAFLDKTVVYLMPYMEFVNCHMVGYLTENLWDKYMTKEIKDEVQSISDIECAIDSIWTNMNSSNDKSDLSAVQKFLYNARLHNLENCEEIVLTKDAFLLNILGSGIDRIRNPLKIKEFMSVKKNHEVEILAELINELVLNNQKESSETFIIDAGDGKGYLSSRLSLEYQLKVLGVDARETTTIGAQKRNKKLTKAWNGLRKKAEHRQSEDSMSPKQSNDRKQIVNEYKSVSEFITPDTDFVKLLGDHFEILEENNNQIGLVGLHTCGNLAPTCLRTFVAQDSIRLLCNVGCCYHFLNPLAFESTNLSTKDVIADSNNAGFPMSLFLKEKKFSLARNSRMLAAQSVDRILNKKELCNPSLFYRALLEVIVHEKRPDLKNRLEVGKLKKCTNFWDYFYKSSEKLRIDITDIDENYVNSLLSKYEKEKLQMNLFYLIRMHFAEILEAIILVDRLLYLKENCIQNSYLVKMFDPIISPRGYAIIAIK